MAHDNNKLAQSRLERLTRTLSELMDKATQNERILRNFQQFELELLAVNGLEALLDSLLSNSLRHFRLDAVELWLFDPERILRDLLSEELQHSPGLFWFERDDELRALYPAPFAVRLSSPPPVGLFAGRAGALRGVAAIAAPRCAGRQPAFWRIRRAAFQCRQIHLFY